MSNKLKLKESPCEFVAENHTYVSKTDGKLWPGCTSILDNLNKPFLGPWMAKEAIGEAVRRIGEIGLALQENPSPEKAIEILQECKSSWRKKSKDALESGTIAHDFMEQFVKAKIAGGKTPKITSIKDKNAKQSVKEFLKWQKVVKPVWLASEIVVGSQVHEFGGKIDAVCSIDGVPTVVDFKTSSMIGKEAFLQLAAYELALDEMGIKVWQRLVLRVPKDGAGFEALIVPTPLDLDRQTFLALRQVQRWQSFTGNENNGVTKNGKVIVAEKTK